jgi:hypothetical protein
VFNGANFCRALVVLAAAWWLSGSAAAQIVTVGSGASLAVGNGSVDLGCGDLSVVGSVSLDSGTFSTVRNVAIVSGALSLGNGAIILSGDWDNSGSVTAGTGRVEVVDGCAITTSVITGDTGFHDFSVVTSGGRLLQVAAGSTQTFGNSITLRGSPDIPLVIRSSSSGTPASFVLLDGASQDISGVDVADNDASAGQTLAPVEPAEVDSVDAGNNSNWFIAMLPPAIAKPITTLPLPGLLILSGLLAVLARRFLRTVHTLETSAP